MDRHEKLAHQVLRIVRPQTNSLEYHTEYLRQLPGGGDDYEWTRNRWEACQFANRTEADEYAKRFNGHACPRQLPEAPTPSRPLPAPEPRPHQPHHSRHSQTRRIDLTDRKLFGYGIDD